MKGLIQSIKSNQSGLTMVELIVAVAVFLAIVAIAFGIFIRSVRIQRLVNTAMSMNSNASLSLEQIMRELRSGFNFSATDSGSACGALGLSDTLTFERARGAGTATVVYHWNSAAGDIERTEGTSPATILTAADVDVHRWCFSILQDISTDPWRITMFLQIGPRNDSAPENIVNLQTTVSARILPSEVQ